MAEDKFGNQIEKGDTVEFVYGGDAYATPVDALAEMEGRTWVQATITVFIPTGSVALTQKAEKPTKPSVGAGSHPGPQAEGTPTADAPKTSSTKGKK